MSVLERKNRYGKIIPPILNAQAPNLPINLVSPEYNISREPAWITSDECNQFPKSKIWKVKVQIRSSF